MCQQPGRKKDREDITPKWSIRYLDEIGLGRPPAAILWICNPCNNWLNSNFENPARDLLKPLMAGSPVELSIDEQIIVARWLAKTLLLRALKDAEHPSRGPLPRVDRRQHAQRIVREVMDTERPPADCLIYIGHFDETLPFEETSRDDLSYLTRILPPLSFKAQVNFGRLYCQMFIGGDGLPLIGGQLARAIDRLIPVWPQRLDSATFPPAKSFSMWDRVLITSRWSAESEPAYDGQ